MDDDGAGVDLESYLPSSFGVRSAGTDIEAQIEQTRRPTYDTRKGNGREEAALAGNDDS